MSFLCRYGSAIGAPDWESKCLATLEVPRQVPVATAWDWPSDTHRLVNSNRTNNSSRRARTRHPRPLILCRRNNCTNRTTRRRTHTKVQRITHTWINYIIIFKILFRLIYYPNSIWCLFVMWKNYREIIKKKKYFLSYVPFIRDKYI